MLVEFQRLNGLYSNKTGLRWVFQNEVATVIARSNMQGTRGYEQSDVIRIFLCVQVYRRANFLGSTLYFC